MQKALSVSVANSKPLTVAGTANDIDSPGFLNLLSKRIANDLDEYAAVAYDDGHRNHLGASLLGDDCKRKLWYVFRWVKREQFSGRQQRLFQRGHSEENRYLEWLRGSGFQVWSEDEKGAQFRISYANGHGGGSLDAIIKFPPAYGIDMPVLGEFKTNGTGAGFNKLVGDGVQLAKPVHYAQMCIYGSDPVYQFTHGAYFNINKNDDSLHVEVIKLDWKLGAALREKGTAVIESQKPPTRISENPTYFSCKYCTFSGICFKNEPVETNCRSCKHARPVENKGWFCTLPAHNAIIPPDFIPKGCAAHHSINSL